LYTVFGSRSEYKSKLSRTSEKIYFPLQKHFTTSPIVCNGERRIISKEKSARICELQSFVQLIIEKDDSTLRELSNMLQTTFSKLSLEMILSKGSYASNNYIDNLLLTYMLKVDLTFHSLRTSGITIDPRSAFVGDLAFPFSLKAEYISIPHNVLRHQHEKGNDGSGR
jgi:hypothetical protein